MFAFQTLGVMADAAEAIATDADVSVGHPRGETRLPSCVPYVQYFGAPRYMYVCMCMNITLLQYFICPVVYPFTCRLLTY